MSKIKTNRVAGDDYAEEICFELNTGYPENYKLDITKNSGATRRDGDMKNEVMVLDCKADNKGKPTGSIKSSEAKKVDDQATKHGRYGFLVTETADGPMVTCTLETFRNISGWWLLKLDEKNNGG